VTGIGLTACVTDLRTRRIPNRLTLGAAAAGVIVQVIAAGSNGALAAASGWLLGAVLFLPFFMLGGMGGGDVKLLAALGAWLGPHDTLWLAVYSALAGGVLGVIVAVMHGYLRSAFANIFAMLKYWQTAGIGPVPHLTLDSPNAPRLAYAIPIFFGTMVILWL
jgi:prepilin peptidase CpaA